VNGYIALYRGRRAEIFADTSREAQQKAAAIFKARKVWEVSVYMVEKNGETVTYSTSSI
jgi:hypothetical protein